MPLTIGPVKVFQSETPESQAKGVQRQAVSLQLTPTIIHALKQAIAAARADGRIPPAGNYGTGITPEQSPLQVALAGDNPGISIAGTFYPLNIQPLAQGGNNHAAQPAVDLFTRTRMLHPKKARDHRPDMFYSARVVASAVIQRPNAEASAQQKLRETTALADKKRKERTIQVLNEPVPPATGTKGSSVKKRKAVGSGTVSNLGRAVLEKNVGVMAKNEGRSGTSSSSAGPSSSKPSSSPTPDFTSLRSRVIHQLALKAATAADLRNLVKPGETGLSEILRSVATPELSKPTKASSSHWASQYAAPTNHPGLWYLKPEICASSVWPFSWPHYDDSDRRRIAEDVESAFSELGLPDTAPDRTRLRQDESAWNKKRRLANGEAGSASGSGMVKKPTAQIPGMTTRKVKIHKLSEPPTATGSTLSANVRKGVVASSSASKPKKAADRGSGRDSDVEPVRAKRPSPPTATSGRATPLSASSTTSSGASAAPLAHGLPQRPQTGLSAPPTTQRNSRTPPPPIPRTSSAQQGRTPTPSGSPHVASSKRDQSELEDGKRNGLNVEKKRKSEVPSAISSTSAALKAATSSHQSSAAGKRIDPSSKTRAPSNQPESISRPASSQSLKPPIALANGRTTSAGSTKSSDRGMSPLPSFKRNNPSASPIAASSLSQSTGKRPAEGSARAVARPDHARKVRRNVDYTSSSEEEEEEEEELPRPKKKPALGKSRPLSPPRARSRLLPSPLPMSRPQLRSLYSERHADQAALWAAIADQKLATERAQSGKGDPANLWSEQEMTQVLEDYSRLHREMNVLQKAVQDSLDAEGRGE